MTDRADDLGAAQRHRLGVIARTEWILGHEDSLRLDGKWSVESSERCHADLRGVADPMVAGSSAPTSTPRWASRHRTASGKRECPSLAMLGMRRRAPNRDLREALAHGISPPAQRRPGARRLARDLPGAHTSPDLANGLANDQPQRQRHRDRGEPVVLERSDTTRDDGEHRSTVRALVAAAHDRHGRRAAVDRRRASQLAVPHTVTVEAEQPTGRATRLAARACRWSGRLDRRRCCKPGLDVERVMDDV